MSLEQYVRMIQKKYALSLSGLAERLGYRSKTSLTRIMAGNARPQSIRKFEEAVLSGFELSEDEIKQLSETVQIAIYGEERLMTNRAVWEFLRERGSEEAGRSVRVTDVYSGCLLDLNERYASADRMELTILNCQSIGAVFNSVKRLLRQRNAKADHFIYINENDVRTLNQYGSLISLFYDENYNCYAHRKPGDSRIEEWGLKDCDAIIVSWFEADGRARSDMLLFRGIGEAALLELPYLGEDSLARLGIDKAAYAPIKQGHPEVQTFADYIRYSRDYFDLERNRSVWKIKPDLGVDQIPAWILRKAIEEGPLPVDDGMRKVLDRLETLYDERFRNSFSKHKHCYTVFKRNAMRKFAMTGRATDHFWMMRPYTPAERIVILSELLKQQRENPYVHFCFLKDNATVRDIEIACYEDRAMLILDPNTDYNMQNGYAEIRIVDQKMLSLYREFFMNDLLDGYVCSESETCDFLRHLIFEVEAISTDI